MRDNYNYDDGDVDDLHKDADHKKNTSRNSLSTVSGSSDNDDLDDLQKILITKKTPRVTRSPQPTVRVSEVHLLSSPEWLPSDDCVML